MSENAAWHNSAPTCLIPWSSMSQDPMPFPWHLPHLPDALPLHPSLCPVPGLPQQHPVILVSWTNPFYLLGIDPSVQQDSSFHGCAACSSLPTISFLAHHDTHHRLFPCCWGTAGTKALYWASLQAWPCPASSNSQFTCPYPMLLGASSSVRFALVHPWLY